MPDPSANSSYIAGLLNSVEQPINQLTNHSNWQVQCVGTLNVKLERYKNDTCGGYVLQNGDCEYRVSLSITSLIFRGGSCNGSLDLQSLY